MKNIKMTSQIKYSLARCETKQNLFLEREQLVAKVILTLIARNIVGPHQIWTQHLWKTQSTAKQKSTRSLKFNHQIKYLNVNRLN